MDEAAKLAKVAKLKDPSFLRHYFVVTIRKFGASASRDNSRSQGPTALSADDSSGLRRISLETDLSIPIAGCEMQKYLYGDVMKDYKIDDPFTIKLPQLTKGIDNDLISVSPTSPLAHRKIVEWFGYYFKRELGYDFPAFEGSNDEVYKAWIFASNKRGGDWRAFGACEFNPHDTSSGQCWTLEWIWFHPYFREKGYLKKAWPILIAEFSAVIEVRPPYSRAMLNFLHSTDPKTLGIGTKRRLQKPKN